MDTLKINLISAAKFKMETMFKQVIKKVLGLPSEGISDTLC